MGLVGRSFETLEENWNSIFSEVRVLLDFLGSKFSGPLFHRMRVDLLNVHFETVAIRKDLKCDLVCLVELVDLVGEVTLLGSWVSLGGHGI